MLGYPFYNTKIVEEVASLHRSERTDRGTLGISITSPFRSWNTRNTKFRKEKENHE
jgi:hypothetical protein